MNEEIKLADNIYYQMNLDNNGFVFHNIKYKIPKNINIAIKGENKVFKGFFKVVMAIGEKGYKDKIYFSFVILDKNEEKPKEYTVRTGYETISFYLGIKEGIELLEVALKKFKEINNTTTNT